jgi:prephenate dehydrogenase
VETVAIFGVGLIGGSFALALREAGFSGEIIGVSSPETLARALDLEVIDRAAPPEQAAREADLIYLAQPILRILYTLAEIGAWVRPDALVTDAGSTKRAIVAQARATLRRCQFLGGHPMAGKEKRGVAEADADLFAGRTYVLTPTRPEELETEVAQEFLEWLHRIGARTLVLEAGEHDRIVSYTSHLAQLASTALAATVAESVPPDRLQTAGPGLADTTRLAMSSYDLWRDILATNTEAVERALSVYIQKLEHLRSNLRTRQLQEEFEIAARLAEKLRR